MAEVVLFADAPSLWYYAKLYGRVELGQETARVDYAALRQVLADGRRVLSAHCYVRRKPGLGVESFIRALEHLGWQVHVIDPSTRMEAAIASDMGQVPPTVARVLATGEGGYGPFPTPAPEAAVFPMACPAREWIRHAACTRWLDRSVLQISEAA